MKINREEIKAKILKGLIFEIEICNLQIKLIDYRYDFISVSTLGLKMIYLQQRAASIMRTPAILFGKNGKIDKRRRKRYGHINNSNTHPRGHHRGVTVSLDHVSESETE